MVYVTWQSWSPGSYMVKTFKTLILLNQKADDFETWYVALVTQVLPNLFKWWPWVDLDLFYSKVKFGPFCFCMGKCLSCRFPRNYWSLWGEYRCTYSQIHLYLTIYDQGQGHSLTFVQGHSDSTFSNFFSSRKHWAIWSQIPYEASMGCWDENMFRCSGSHDQDSVQSHIWWKPSKTTFFGTKRLGIQHRVLKLQLNLYIWWQWVDLDHFYDMIKFVF